MFCESVRTAANQFLDVMFTKIGGMPTWIQDAEYPKCPKCEEEMMFVGQVSREDFLWMQTYKLFRNS